MVKVLKTKEDIVSIKDKKYIIEYGTPSHCMPCKMLLECLETFEKENKFKDVAYYHCDNIDIMTECGYTSVPVLKVVSKEKSMEIMDTSVLLDEDELFNLINEVME